MGGGGPSLIQPAPTAQTQFGYNIGAGEAALVGSQPNQAGPFGTISTAQTGTQTINVPGYGNISVPTEAQTTTLSPAEQELLGLQQTAGMVGGAEVPGLIGGYAGSNPATAIGSTTSGLMGGAENQFQQYETPFFNQQTEALQSQLANQGLTPGTPAYDAAMNNLRQSQGQTTSGFLSQMEPAAFSQALQEYMLPMGEAQTLEGFNQPATPSEIQYPGFNLSPPNYEGDVSAYNTAQVQEYQAQQQFMGNLFAGLGNLGMAGAKLWSDRRLKEDIKKIGSLWDICDVYSFRWKGTRRYEIGLMADEVQKFAPEAVGIRDGWLTVNYLMAVEASRRIATAAFNKQLLSIIQPALRPLMKRVLAMREVANA